MAVLTVTGVDRLHLVADNPEATAATFGRILGTSGSPSEVRFLVGNVPVEISATSRPAIERPGWRALTWAVASFEDVPQVLAERAISYDRYPDEQLIRTHPENPAGICWEFADSATSHRQLDNMVGTKRTTIVKVAATRPAAAAAAIGELTGVCAYAREHPHLNAIGHRIVFPDHAIEFVGSKTNSSQDLVGRFLAEHGEGILCLTLEVHSLERTRKDLVDREIAFSQWGRSSLLLGPQLTHGALFELTDSA